MTLCQKLLHEAAERAGRKVHRCLCKHPPGDLWGVGARRRCAVHPQVGSSRQYECGKAMPKSALDGVDDVKEGYKQGNKPHKERCKSQLNVST